MLLEQLARLPNDFPHKFDMIDDWTVGDYETLSSNYAKKVATQYCEKIDKWLK